MSEAVFRVELEIPTNMRAKVVFKQHLLSLLPQVGTFGKNGEDIGMGFIWETQTGLTGNLNLYMISKRMLRALRATGIVHRNAEPYFLTQRIIYIRDGEPNIVFTLKD